ncbi:heavy-metal-associated domain-containing protein [Belliella baltica]|nr:heavy-metal-associated domain-containing protein [Belliella baltica]
MNVINSIARPASNVQKNAANVRKHVKKWLLKPIKRVLQNKTMNSMIKKSKAVLLICFGFGILLINFEARAQSQEKQNSLNMENTEAKTQVLQLTVEGMSCQEGCANGIDNLLKQQDGIIKSKTIFDTSSSEIHYDKSKISEKQIIALIEKRGFKTKIKEEQK